MRYPNLLWPLLALAVTPVFAIGTAFTFQGTLEDDGQPADGVYDLSFQLKTGLGTNLGAPITLEDQNVVGGVFTVQLDFGDLAFAGPDRTLELSVRPGASSGLFTPLSPVLPVHPAPYAQRAATAEQALDVTDFAIDEIDIGTAQVSARNIAAAAVGASELALDAVTSAKIADGTILAADIGNNTLTLAKFRGQSSNYTISATIAANDCNDFDVTFGGDVLAGDVPILNIQPGFQLPDSMSVTALRVIADNLVELRICNEAPVQQSTGTLGIRLTTLR